MIATEIKQQRNINLLLFVINPFLHNTIRLAATTTIRNTPMTMPIISAVLSSKYIKIKLTMI